MLLCIDNLFYEEIKMSLKSSIVLIGLGLIVIFTLAWIGAENIFRSAVHRIKVTPGDIVFSEISTAGDDWVTLHNNTNRPIDLSGFILTDGDNRFVIPEGADARLGAGEEVSIVRTSDSATTKIKYAWKWGNWGLKKEGELVALLDHKAEIPVDFVLVPPMTRGQTLKRDKLIPDPSLRPLADELIEKAAKSFRSLAVSLAAFIAFFVTFLTNLQTILGFLRRIKGLTGNS